MLPLSPFLSVAFSLSLFPSVKMSISLVLFFSLSISIFFASYLSLLFLFFPLTLYHVGACQLSRQSAQLLVRKSQVRSPLGPPAPYKLGRNQYNVTVRDRSHGLPVLSRVWQYVILSDVGLATHPRYSLVVDEHVQK